MTREDHRAVELLCQPMVRGPNGPHGRVGEKTRPNLSGPASCPPKRLGDRRPVRHTRSARSQFNVITAPDLDRKMGSLELPKRLGDLPVRHIWSAVIRPTDRECRDQ